MRKYELVVLLLIRSLAFIAAILVFGGLAREFHQWWIALFSLLYTFSFEHKIERKRDGDNQADE